MPRYMQQSIELAINLSNMRMYLAIVAIFNLNVAVFIKVALRILEAAKSLNAAQFVLVSSSGAGGGGGFLGGLFGGGAPNASKVEQACLQTPGSPPVS